MLGGSECYAGAIRGHRAGLDFTRLRRHCSDGIIVVRRCGFEGFAGGLVRHIVALHLPLVGVGVLTSILAAAVSGAEGARVGHVCEPGRG